MVKISLRLRKIIGLDFFEFLKETARTSITERIQLKEIYDDEFRTRNDPDFSSVLYALKVNHKITMRWETIYFKSTVRHQYLDQWPTQNGAASPGPARPIIKAENATTGVRARRKLASLLKDRLQMDRDQLISDKHGVSISSKSVHQCEGGKLCFCVEGTNEYVVNLTVENTGTKPVYFTYYTPLHWLRDFTLKDERKVTKANPLRLNPGDDYEIQVRYQRSFGWSSATLAFEFQRDLQSDTAFHIVRFIEACSKETWLSLLHADHERTHICQRCMLFYNLFVVIAPNKRTALERITVKQSESELWHDARKVRITASTAKRVPGPRGNPYNYIKERLDPKFRGNVATEHGIKCEAFAYKWLEDHGYAVRRSGTVVCASEPWLSASPDGVLNSKELLEIKCPYKPLDELMRDPQYDLQRVKGKIVLKENGARGFYVQAQVGMFCTGLRTCKMLIYPQPPLKPFLLEDDIVYDERSCNEIVDRCRSFYFKLMLPILSDEYQAGRLWLSASYLTFCGMGEE